MTIPSEHWEHVDNISDMKGSEKSLLSFLCRKANPKKNYSSWYSVSEMARILCISEKTVKRSSSGLERMGLITKKKRKDSSSVYVVNLTEIQEQAVNNEIGKGHYDPSLGSNCPSVGVTMTYKNVIENVNENVITGGAFASQETPDINSRTLALYKSIKLFVANRYIQKLPKDPSCEDIEAIEWANEFFELESLGLEITSLCEFAIKELGEPERILNPIVRLSHAYDALEAERGEMEANNRFRYGFECYE